MQRKLRLMLAYDGSDFHGWQRQPGVRTVQGVLEGVASAALGESVEVIGASRTDAGVHALGQCAHLVTATPVPDERIAALLNHRLPDDLAVVALQRAADSFDAIRDARRKLYRYRIHDSERKPVCSLAQRYVWHVPHPLDAYAMRAAAADMIGTHDFAAFASAGSPRESTVRTVFDVRIERCEHEIVLEVEGDGFLYNQVRNMVGTLVEIGRGHWQPERVATIIASADRRQAGPTAAACGLCLVRVAYASDGA